MHWPDEEKKLLNLALLYVWKFIWKAKCTDTDYFYLHFLGNQKKKCGKRKSGERRENPQKSIDQNVAEAKTLLSDLEKVRIHIPRRPQKISNFFWRW